VTVKVDSKASRTLPVEIRVTGAAAAGTVVTQATTDPQQVAVAGPKSLVEAVDRAVLPLDLDGRKADFTAQVAPLLVGRDGKALEGLTVSPERVNVAVTLARGLTKKRVGIKAIVFGDLTPGYSLKALTATPPAVEISGDPETLAKIDFVYTEPVSVAGIARDTDKEAKLQIKEGVVASQDAVTVKISVGR